MASFKSILRGIGTGLQIAGRVAGVLPPVGPINAVTRFIPVVESILGTTQAIVADTELAFQGPGRGIEKAAAAMQAFAPTLDIYNSALALAGKRLAWTPEEYQREYQKVLDAQVLLMNTVDAFVKGMKVEDLPKE